VDGVVKTTVYLPDSPKQGVERLARERRVSGAEVIRAAPRGVHVARATPPELPLFDSGEVDPIENVDEALEGFGER
jgi:hypothetical protein